MKPKEILVFGASGQIGRHLVRKLTKNNYKVIAVTRNTHQKGYILKPLANPGYLELIEINSFSPDKIKDLVKKCSICINLIGILFEKEKNSFKKIHTEFPDLLSKIANDQKIDQLIHISALGIDNATESKYASSKIDGEKAIRKNFNQSVILKPSLIYSVDDRFSTSIMTLLNRLPFMPLYYQGKTKFTPIHVNDMTDIIFEIIKKNITSKTIECVGPEVFSFKEIILKLLKSIDKKRLLIPMPLFLSKLMARIFEIMPEPLITTDQLKILNYNNVVSGKYITNFDLGFKANRKFETEIEKYSYSWKSGGQFSKKNFSNSN